MKHARIRTGAVLVLVAVAASCSDGDSADPSTTAPPSATSAPAATTTPGTIAAVATTAQAGTTAPTATTASSGTSVPVATTAPGTLPPPRGDAELLEGTVEAFYAVPDPLPAGEPGRLLRYQRVGTAVMPFEPDPSFFFLETPDVDLWMLSDPVALLASPPGDELVPDPQVGDSLDELVAWLVGHPELDTSEPEPVSIGGLDGFQVDVAITAGSTATSPGCLPAEVCVDLFASPDLGWHVGLLPDFPFSRRILLATPDGGTVVISLYPGESLVGDRTAFDGRADLLIDSLDIDFTPEAAGPDRAATTEFRPAFSYAIPKPGGDAPACGESCTCPSQCRANRSP